MEIDPQSSVARRLVTSIYLQVGDTRAEESSRQHIALLSRELSAMEAQGMPTDAKRREIGEAHVGVFESRIQSRDLEGARQALQAIPEGESRDQAEARLREAEDSN